MPRSLRPIAVDVIEAYGFHLSVLTALVCLKLIVFFASLRIFATSSGLMVTVLDVVLEGRILRAFGTLADNSAHIVGLFFLFLFTTQQSYWSSVEIYSGLRLPLYSMAVINLNRSLGLN